MQGCFVLANRRIAELLGLTLDEIIGRTATELLPADVAVDSDRQDKEVLDRGTIIQFETELPNADGSVRQVLLTKFPVMDGMGRTGGIGTVTTDVTERKKVEERLRQAQKFAALGQLTGGVANDFNNLLAVILGNANLLRMDVPSDEGLLQSIDEIRQASVRGAELTQRLLAFSGQQPLQSRPVDLVELLAESERMLRHTLGETVRVEAIPPVGPCQALADRTQLENALLNLAINAGNAMPDGGSLKIIAENTEISGQETAAFGDVVPGNFVVISVVDTGEGMSQAVIDRVFEPFFTTRDVGEGSGLGLSMVYGFARQSGGHVAIDSVEGVGTTVRLYLPCALSAEPAPAAAGGRAHNRFHCRRR